MERVVRKLVEIIEKIVSITRDKNQYQIKLESGDYFRVSEDVLVRFRLLKDMEVAQKTIDEAKAESQLDYGYQMALNYLSYQLRSEKEIATYLSGKEIDHPSINKIMVRLQELKLVDDLVYAESYVRTQVRLGDKGPRVVTQNLKKRGIAEETIMSALEFYPFEEQLTVALAVGTKAERKYQRSSHSEKIQKIRQFLMTKGFDGDVITETLTSLAIEKDEEDEAETLATQGDKLWRKNQRFDARKRRDKVTQSLFRKGFSFDLINAFIAEKELEDEE